MPTFVTAQRPILPHRTENAIDLAAHKTNNCSVLSRRECVGQHPSSPRKRATPAPSWSLFGPKSLLRSLGKRTASAVADDKGAAYPEPRLQSTAVAGRPVPVASQASLRAQEFVSAQAPVVVQEPAQAAATPADGMVSASTTVDSTETTPAPYRSLLHYPLSEVLATEKSYHAGLGRAIAAYQDFLQDAQTRATPSGAKPLPLRDVMIAGSMVRDLTRLKNISEELINKLQASLPIKTDEDRQRYCSAIAELTTSNEFVSAMWHVVKNFKHIKDPESGVSKQLFDIEKAGGSDGNSIVAVQRLARYPMMFDEVVKQCNADKKQGLEPGTDYAEVAEDLHAMADAINMSVGSSSAPSALFRVSYSRGSHAPEIIDPMAAIIAQNRKFAMNPG